MFGTTHRASLLCILLSALTASAADVASVSITPASVPGGLPAMGTVTLSEPAPTGGQWISLSRDVPSASMVSQVRVPEGETTAVFPLATTAVSADTVVFVTATAGTSSAMAPLTVTAPVPIDSMALTPSTVNGGSTFEISIALQSPAPPGGTLVQFSSSQPAVVALPQRILIPGGSQSYSLVLNTSAVTTTTAVTVTTSAASDSHTSTLTVLGNAPQGALEMDSGCQAVTLPANDDGSTGAVSLPFPLNFYGSTYTYLFVNNNGNVTFQAPLQTFTPFTITASTPPIIAPFLADVDTRGGGSPVQYSYGAINLGGRAAFCINWINVGYYDSHTDKLNSFQLLLVERGDIAPGDFDVIMNYGKVQWETGDASDGSHGLGGTSAGAGFSAGNGNPNAFFQLPGSLVNGAFLDSSVTTGLTWTSHNSLIPGRHLFEVRNGQPVGNGVMSGNVRAANELLPGAPVQVCPDDGGICVYSTLTDSTGHFRASGLRPGTYVLKVFPPAGSDADPRTMGPFTFTGNESLVQDVALSLPVPPPPNITLTPSRLGDNGIPAFSSRQAVDLRMEGCPGGSATWSVVTPSGLAASGTMTEGPSALYSAAIPPLAPATGRASISIRLVCPNGIEHLYGFDVALYIDPSGTVRTPAGAPVQGATVVVYRSDRPYGPFLQVPHGSAILSPDNRRNPDVTDSLGNFRWDVISGYYKVRASKQGCVSTSGAPYVESSVMAIPPPVTGADLRLVCDTTPPTSQATLSGSANALGWHREPVTVVLTATDTGVGVREILWASSGAQVGSARVAGDGATVQISTEGETRLTWTALDQAGNPEAAHTLLIRIDSTPPEFTCRASPEVLAPADHLLHAVDTIIQMEDALSGPSEFTLNSVMSRVPGSGSWDELTVELGQGWEPGLADTQGMLRAEGSGGGAGRTYTLRYEGRDQAGNLASCRVNVFVPGDSG